MLRTARILKAKTGDAGKLSALDIAGGGLDEIFQRLEDEDEGEVYEMLERWAGKNYGFIESGSSRAVYKIDDDHALKIAINEKGQGQNLVESHIAQKFHSLPITKVHYVEKTGLLMVVDFAHKLNEAHFKDKFGLSFDKFSKLCGLLCRQGYRNEKKRVWGETPEEAKRLIRSLVSHGLLLGDLGSTEQWGDLKEKPVLVDYGCNHQVWKEHYAVWKVSRILLASVEAPPLEGKVAPSDVVGTLNSFVGEDFDSSSPQLIMSFI